MEKTKVANKIKDHFNQLNIEFSNTWSFLTLIFFLVQQIHTLAVQTVVCTLLNHTKVLNVMQQLQSIFQGIDTTTTIYSPTKGLSLSTRSLYFPKKMMIHFPSLRFTENLPKPHSWHTKTYYLFCTFIPCAILAYAAEPACSHRSNRSRVCNISNNNNKFHSIKDRNQRWQINVMKWFFLV